MPLLLVPRHLICAALLGVPEYSASQQVEGQVPVPTSMIQGATRQNLGQAKWISMLDLKVGFYNIPI